MVGVNIDHFSNDSPLVNQRMPIGMKILDEDKHHTK